MQGTYFSLFIALAACAAAYPRPATHPDGASIARGIMKRSTPASPDVARRAELALEAYRKRDDDLAESVNYIFVLEKSNSGVDAYSDEVNAVTDPATVLGKRSEDLAESVNYIFVLEKSNSGVDAYSDEVNAVTDPSTVLG
jgi:hypothetical protein